jgi:hypothetical protein
MRSSPPAITLSAGPLGSTSATAKRRSSGWLALCRWRPTGTARPRSRSPSPPGGYSSYAGGMPGGPVTSITVDLLGTPPSRPRRRSGAAPSRCEREPRRCAPARPPAARSGSGAGGSGDREGRRGSPARPRWRSATDPTTSSPLPGDVERPRRPADRGAGRDQPAELVAAGRSELGPRASAHPGPPLRCEFADPQPRDGPGWLFGAGPRLRGAAARTPQPFTTSLGRSVSPKIRGAGAAAAPRASRSERNQGASPRSQYPL